MDHEHSIPSETAKLIADRCLCLGVQRASRIIGRRFDEALRPLGLNNWQFSLLINLLKAEPPSIGKLADALGTDRTTITANVKPLERRGLLEIQRDKADARTRRVALTDAGRSLLAEAVERWREVNASVEQDLEPDELAVFRSALRRLGS